MLLSAQYVIPVSADPIEGGAVLVRDGKIADLGPAEMMKLRYPEEDVKDFGMAALTPGFIDLHARIEDAAFRGLVRDQPFVKWRREIADLRRSITVDEAYDSAFLGGLEALSSGITTIADTTTTGACVSAVNDLGLRGVMYREAGAIDKRLVNYALKKMDCDLEKWSQFIDSERITVGVSPTPTYECHPELYRAIARYATENGDLPVTMSLAGSREEYHFVRYGAISGLEPLMEKRGFVEVPPWMPSQVSPVNYVLNWGLFEAKNVMLLYGVYVDEDDMEHLKKYDVALAVAPGLNAQLGMGLAPVSEYLRAGLRVGIGTGTPGSIDLADMFTEMRLEMLLERSANHGSFIDSQTLIEMGTLRAAQVLRIDDKVGSLEPGKLADIIAVDLSGSRETPTSDPVSALLSSGSGSDVMMTMVGGSILYERGSWHVQGEVAKNIAHVLEIRSRLRK